MQYEKEVFETEFAKFWGSQECDDLNWVIFDMIKAAYAAGYRAAGKKPPKYRDKVRTLSPISPISPTPRHCEGPKGSW